MSNRGCNCRLRRGTCSCSSCPNLPPLGLRCTCKAAGFVSHAQHIFRRANTRRTKACIATVYLAQTSAMSTQRLSMLHITDNACEDWQCMPPGCALLCCQEHSFAMLLSCPTSSLAISTNFTTCLSLEVKLRWGQAGVDRQ